MTFTAEPLGWDKEEKSEATGSAPLVVATRCKDECTFGHAEEVKEVHFGVKFGELFTCTKCGWRVFDDWTAVRVGSVKRWWPPAVEGASP